MQREVFIFSSGPMVRAKRAIDAQYGGKNLETPDRDLDPANARSMHLMPTALHEIQSVLSHRVPYASEVVSVTRDKRRGVEPARGHVLSHVDCWNILGSRTEITISQLI